MADKVPVQVDGRTLTLSNLDKVLYPEVGFTKGEVLDYYTRIAPVLVPHAKDRPLTFKRYPDGVEGKFFFEKNAPSHAPDWVRRVELPSPGSTKNRSTISYAVLADLPTLVWAANLATLELHVPMWRGTPRGKPRDPRTLLFGRCAGSPPAPSRATLSCWSSTWTRPRPPRWWSAARSRHTCAPRSTRTGCR